MEETTVLKKELIKVKGLRSLAAILPPHPSFHVADLRPRFEKLKFFLDLQPTVKDTIMKKNKESISSF
jgi:hypothetical protein